MPGDSRTIVGSATSRGASPRNVERSRLAVMVDGHYPAALIQNREHAFHDLAPGQHVGHAAWHAKIVLEHDEPAVGPADEIGPDHRQIAALRHVHATHLAAIVPARVDNLARDDLVRQDAALMINVLQKQIEGGDALGEARLDLPPLGASDNARQQVVRKDLLGPLLAAVNVKGNSLDSGRQGPPPACAAEAHRPESRAACCTALDSAGVARLSCRTFRPTRRQVHSRRKGHGPRLGRAKPYSTYY